MPDQPGEDLSQPDDVSQLQDEQPTPAPGEAEELPADIGGPTRPRALAIGVAGIAAAVVVAVVIATSGNGSPGHHTMPAQEIRALLAGIPQSGNALGSPTAPVTLQYFGDLQCSTARAFTLGALPYIIRKWVKPGIMRIEYRSFRTVSEPEVFSTQQVAALAAGMQHKLWYYMESFYHEQGREHSGYVTEAYLRSLARQVPGLRLELWGEDRHDPLLAAQVTQDERAAYAAGLHKTPSFLIGRTGSTAFHPTAKFSLHNLTPFNESVRLTLHSQADHGRRLTRS